MKYTLMASFVLLLSTSAFGAHLHTCAYKDFSLKISSDKKADIQIEIFNKGKKVSSCSMKALSYDDGTTGAASTELIRFKKESCNIIYDKVAAKISIQDQGFIKYTSGDKASYAYVVKNEQPLNAS